MCRVYLRLVPRASFQDEALLHGEDQAGHGRLKEAPRCLLTEKRLVGRQLSGWPGLVLWGCCLLLHIR